MTLVAVRKTEEEMENYFSYELIPYQTSLFKVEEVLFRKCHNF